MILKFIWQCKIIFLVHGGEHFFHEKCFVAIIFFLFQLWIYLTILLCLQAFCLQRCGTLGYWLLNQLILSVKAALNYAWILGGCLIWSMTCKLSLTPFLNVSPIRPGRDCLLSSERPYWGTEYMTCLWKVSFSGEFKYVVCRLDKLLSPILYCLHLLEFKLYSPNLYLNKYFSLSSCVGGCFLWNHWKNLECLCNFINT